MSVEIVAANRGTNPSLEGAVDYVKFTQERLAFAKKWRGQLIASLVVLILGVVSVIWLLHNPNPQWFFAIFGLIAITGFVLKKRYRVIFGFTQICVAVAMAWNVISTAPHLGNDLYNFSDPRYIELILKVVGAVYVMVRGIDDMWESGVLLESLKLGILGPFIAKPGYVVVPHADETDDPITAQELFQGLACVFGEWLHNQLIRLNVFCDILGAATWRSVGTVITLVLIFEAIVWSFLHHMPMLIDIGVVVLGLMGFVTFARWVGNGRILYGLWLLLVSLGFMISFLLIGLSLDRPSPTGTLLACVVMVLCWYPLKRAHRLDKAIKLPPAEQKPKQKR